MKNRLFIFSISFFALFACNHANKNTPIQCASGNTYAEGKLRNFTGHDGCGWVIVLNDNSKLEPTNWDDFTLTKIDGEPVHCCYKEVSAGSICMLGKTVQLATLEPASTTSSDCSGAICTMDYRTVSLKINYVSVPPFDTHITSFKTINTDVGSVIYQQDSISTSDQNMFSLYGYPVVSDGQIPQGTTNLDVTFIGYRNGTEVVRAAMKVSHDCCHISKVSGVSEVNL